MYKWIYSIILLIALGNVKGQSHQFTTGGSSPIPIITDEPDPIKFSTNSFELRITMGGPTRIKVLVFSKKSTQMEAAYYTVDGYNSRIKDGKATKRKAKLIKLDYKKLDSAYSELLYHRIFSLPDENDVVKTTVPLGYLVEYKINDHWGSYRFGLDEQFIPNAPKAKEFEDYKAIIHILNIMLYKADIPGSSRSN